MKLQQIVNETDFSISLRSFAGVPTDSFRYFYFKFAKHFRSSAVAELNSTGI
jgi:hypothetical protein